MARKLTVEEIFEKEFHLDFKGYNALEVDQFLDLVIHDVQFMEDTIRKQKDLIRKYEEALEQQKRLLLEYEGRSRALEDLPKQVSHTDLLKRVSRLEEAVFGQK